MFSFLRNLDYIYVLPAFLCFIAFLAGVIPCVLCLNADFFAWLSVGIFIASLFAHVYMLVLWKRYKHSSPLAYALTQPFAHFIILTFALSVGSVNLCQPTASSTRLTDNELILDDTRISDFIGQN